MKDPGGATSSARSGSIDVPRRSAPVETSLTTCSAVTTGTTDVDSEHFTWRHGDGAFYLSAKTTWH